MVEIVIDREQLYFEGFEDMAVKEIRHCDIFTKRLAIDTVGIVMTDGDGRELIVKTLDVSAKGKQRLLSGIERLCAPPKSGRQTLTPTPLLDNPGGDGCSSGCPGSVEGCSGVVSEPGTNGDGKAKRRNRKH